MIIIGENERETFFLSNGYILYPICILDVTNCILIKFNDEIIKKMFSFPSLTNTKTKK